MHVGKDPCRDQRSVEEETGIGEVVQTIDLEWITLVEEPIAIVHPTLDRAFVVEHIALARAVELGIRRELLLLQAAFIAGIIDLQRSRYLFQHVLHLHQRMLSLGVRFKTVGVERNGIHVQEVDQEIIVVEIIILAEVLQFPGLDPSPETEIPVLFQHDRAFAGIDLHVLRIAEVDHRHAFHGEIVVQQVQLRVHSIVAVAVELQCVVILLPGAVEDMLAHARVHFHPFLLCVVVEVALVRHIDQHGHHLLLLHAPVVGEILRIELPIILLAEFADPHQGMHVIDPQHAHVAVLSEIVEAFEARLCLRTARKASQLHHRIALHPGEHLEIHVQLVVCVVERRFGKTLILLDQRELTSILHETHAHVVVVDRIAAQLHAHEGIVAGDAGGFDAEEQSAADDERFLLPVEREIGRFFACTIALQFRALHGETALEIDLVGDVADVHAPIVALEPRIAGIRFGDVGQHFFREPAEERSGEIRIDKSHRIDLEFRSLQPYAVGMIPFCIGGCGLQSRSFPRHPASIAFPKVLQWKKDAGGAADHRAVTF